MFKKRVSLRYFLNDRRDNIKRKFSYFTEASLFVNIIPQHHDALVSSSRSFYNCHKRQKHIRALLVSLLVFQTYREVVRTATRMLIAVATVMLTYNLHRQTNLRTVSLLWPILHFLQSLLCLANALVFFVLCNCRRPYSLLFLLIYSSAFERSFFFWDFLPEFTLCFYCRISVLHAQPTLTSLTRYRIRSFFLFLFRC